MDNRQIATYLARVRVGFGIGMLIAPRLVLRTMLGPGAGAPAVAPIGRIAGIRDVVLGAGGSISLGERQGGANWVSMGAVCDVVDGVVLGATPGIPWRGRLAGMVVIGLGAYQFLLAKDLAANDQVEG
jgi:hypothetical protein